MRVVRGEAQLADITVQRGRVVQDVPLIERRLGASEAAVEIHPIAQREGHRAGGAGGGSVLTCCHPYLIARITILRASCKSVKALVQLSPVPVPAALAFTW